MKICHTRGERQGPVALEPVVVVARDRRPGGCVALGLLGVRLEVVLPRMPV